MVPILDPGWPEAPAIGNSGFSVRVRSFEGTRHETQDLVAISGTARQGAFVLLDGVSGSGAGCEHGVAWYVQHLGPSILHHLVDHGEWGAAVAMAISEVRGRHPACDFGAGLQQSQTTLVGARWTDNVVELVSLGDSLICLYNAGGALVAVCHDTLERRVSRQRLREVVRIGSVDGYDSARMREWSLHYRNARDGFLLLGADPAVASEMDVLKVDRSSGMTVAAASDGILELAPFNGVEDVRSKFTDLRAWKTVLANGAQVLEVPDRDDVSAVVMSLV